MNDRYISFGAIGLMVGVAVVIVGRAHGLFFWFTLLAFAWVLFAMIDVEADFRLSRWLRKSLTPRP